jgi:hypothetical protein
MTTTHDLARSVRDIAGDRRWLSLGTVVGSVDSADFGRIVYVEVDEDSGVVECRPIVIGVGDGYGSTYTFDVGQEVLVLYPNSDRNSALVLSGPTNRLQQPPSRDAGVVSTTSPQGSDTRRTGSNGSLGVATEETTKALGVLMQGVVNMLQAQQTANTAALAAITTIGVIPDPQTEALRLATSGVIQANNTAITTALSAITTTNTFLQTALSTRNGDPYYSRDLRVGVRFTTAGAAIPAPVVTPGNGKEADKPPPTGVKVNLVIRDTIRSNGYLTLVGISLVAQSAGRVGGALVAAVTTLSERLTGATPGVLAGLKVASQDADVYYFAESTTGPQGIQATEVYALDRNKKVIGIITPEGYRRTR